MRAAIFTLAVMLLASPASAACLTPRCPQMSACLMSYCKDKAPTRSPITNNSRQIVGDLYDPGHGRRVQIRNISGQVLGFIETDGTVTNRSRQPVAKIEVLR